MPESYHVEAAPTPADYQAALEHFFNETATAMEQQSQWIVWAARSGIADSRDITLYNDALTVMADKNTDAAMEFMGWLREQQLSIWVNETGRESHELHGLQYIIGDPWYRAGILQDGEPTMVPLNPTRTLEIRKPLTHGFVAPAAIGHNANELFERYAGHVHPLGPF